MQASALSKSLEISWRALRKASITETIYPWRVLRLTAVSINLYAPVWSAHAGIAKQSRKASNKIFHVDEGTNECKFSREDQEILQKAIAYEAEHGFPNCVGRTKRFSEFLASKLVLPNVLPSHASKTLSLLFDMAQKYAEMDANSRVCLLDKVSAFLGFKSLQDLLDHHHAVIAGNDLDLNTRASEHSDKHPLVILQKNSHPAIVFGSSERLELFKYPESKGGQVGKSSEDGQVGKSSGAFPAKKKVSDSSRAASPVANGRKVKDISSEQKIRVPSNQSRRVKKTVKNVEGDGVYEDWLLNKPINLVKCLSSMACSQLENQGFYTLRKLLQHYPRNYLNFLQPREKIEDGQFLILSGRILSSRVRSAHGLGILQISIGLSAVSKGSDSDEKDSPTFHVTRFFRGARYSSNWFLKRLLEKYPAGAFCAVSGKVKVMEKKNNFEVKDYSLEVVDNADFHHTDLIYPIYSSRGGLSPKFFKLCIEKVLKDLPLDVDPLPEDCKTAYGLMDLREAYIGIHSPQNMMIAEEARKRFVFDEFFFLQLGLLQRRQAEATIMHNVVPTADGSELHAKTGYLPCEKWAPLTSRMYECLPYKLTNSQLKAISEIIWDLQRPIPMRRLLQGDVGCGKTVVGFLALLEVIDAGLQGVLMAPTEFLAKQHYERFCEILKHLEETQRPRIALLTGSVSSVKSQAVRKGLENGSIQLAVGTHSLISDEVRFASLGLVIVDEQHRFGVEQRLRLQNKGSGMLIGRERRGEEAQNTKKSPHVLAMTATPIPRTLAYALYGDMDVTQIKEVPPGRKPVKTIAVFGDEEGLHSTFEMIREQLENGGRVFIVYAVIDESDFLPNLRSATVEFERIKERFPGYTCGLVHGRLKSNERDSTMYDFKSGNIQVLVATSLVEVGIDIMEASMMVVMDAERFGISQLHQLRGRVGRGLKQSTCVLVTSSQNSFERVKLLETSNDGFHLAELDLQIRGPGDMLGRKQSGHLPEFSLACLSRDGELMVRARKAAQDVLQKYPDLESLPKLKRELSLRQSVDSITA